MARSPREAFGAQLIAELQQCAKQPAGGKHCCQPEAADWLLRPRRVDDKSNGALRPVVAIDADWCPRRVWGTSVSVRATTEQTVDTPVALKQAYPIMLDLRSSVLGFLEVLFRPIGPAFPWTTDFHPNHRDAQRNGTPEGRNGRRQTARVLLRLPIRVAIDNRSWPYGGQIVRGRFAQTKSGNLGRVMPEPTRDW